MKREKEIGFLPTVLVVIVFALIFNYVPSDLFKRYEKVSHQDTSGPMNEMGFLFDRIQLSDIAAKHHQENNGNRAAQAVSYLTNTVKPVLDQNPDLMSGDPVKVMEVFNKASFSENKEDQKRKAEVNAELNKMLAALPDKPEKGAESNYVDQLNR